MTGPAAEISGGFAVVGAGAWLFGPAQPAASRGTLRRRGLKGFVCPDRAALSLCEIAAPGSQVPRFKGSKVPSSTDSDGGAPDGVAAAEPSNLRTFEPPAERQAAAAAWCSAANRPFLTRIDCGVPVSAVSEKVLVAPAAARSGARLVRVVPLSFARAIRVTEFAPPSDHPTVEPSDHQTTRPPDHQTTRPPDHRTDSSWVVMATRSRTTRVALADGESLGVRPEAAVAWTGARPSGFCPRMRLLDVFLPRGPRDLLLHFHGPSIVWFEGSEPRPLHRNGPRKAVF